MYLTLLNTDLCLWGDYFRDAIQNIASQLSKLPESAQIETMRDALKDASANILIEIQSHISDLKKAAQRHDEELAGNSKYLARLAESLSDKETRMVNSASEESEKSRQLQVVESVRFIKHVDDVSAIQKRKLDAIINALEKQEQLHSMRNECLTESLRSQQLALDLVDDSVKAFAAKAVDLVVLFDQKMEKVEDHDRYRATKTWLGQFATQLISSGITSAIIGAVVVVSIRAKWDDSDKSNGWSEPKAEIGVRAFTNCYFSVEEEHQRIYSAPRIAAEGQAKVSEMTSDQRECSTNAIKLSSVHVRPPNIPSTFIPNHSPSRKSGQPKRAGLPTSSLASSSSHASSALPHQFSPSNTPRPTSKSSVGNKSYSKHSSTLIDTKISSSSTRTSIQYPTCAATYYDNIHNAPIVRDRGTKNSTLNSSKYSSFVNNTSSRQSQNPLLPSAIFSKSPDLNLWICCRCYRFAGEIEFSHICTFCFHPKCSYCTMRVPAKK